MISKELFNETILGLLGPVRPYLEDRSITEIMINGPSSIYIERKGRLEKVPATFSSDAALLAPLNCIAQFAGKPLDDLNPILEGRLPDGSRVQAIIPPASFGGASLAIRRFSLSAFTADDLIGFGALTPEAAQFLNAIVVAKLNVLVAGGTGSGKTSLLNTLSRSIPATERVVVIEDTKEVQLQQDHVVYLETRAPDKKGRGAVKIRDLFRATLRMRPDRIVIGEIRGGEALDIVQAMVSGHGGCMGTLHATYPRDTMTRLETMAMMSDVEMPLAALRMQLASGVNFIVQAARLHDGSRKITHITEVLGYDMNTMQYELQDIFSRSSENIDPNATDLGDRQGEIVPELLPTGVMPRCMEQLHEHGVDVPEIMYRCAELREAAERGRESRGNR